MVLLFDIEYWDFFIANMYFLNFDGCLFAYIYIYTYILIYTIYLYICIYIYIYMYTSSWCEWKGARFNDLIDYVSKELILESDISEYVQERESLFACRLLERRAVTENPKIPQCLRRGTCHQRDTWASVSTVQGVRHVHIDVRSSHAVDVGRFNCIANSGRHQQMRQAPESLRSAQISLAFFWYLQLRVGNS